MAAGSSTLNFVLILTWFSDPKVTTIGSPLKFIGKQVGNFLSIDRLLELYNICAASREIDTLAKAFGGQYNHA